MSQMLSHAPGNGWDSGGSPVDDGLSYYRTVLSVNDDLRFHGLFARLGFVRPTASAVWGLVRARPWGETKIAPHHRAPLYEFVANDSQARREPLGVLTIRWRRLPTSDRLIDLEIANQPPDDQGDDNDEGEVIEETVDSSQLV